MNKYQIACIEIDKIHCLDKTSEMIDGEEFPNEMLYAVRLVDCLGNFAPNASEQIKLAARCQHFKRWEISRNTYPMDKVGYLNWRKALYVFQSEEAAKILEKVGYNIAFINEVKLLIQKKEIRKNADAQIIEDVACLVFLEYYLEDFSKKHEADKLKSIIAKTWAKMSEHAKAEALKINFMKELKAIIKEALKL
jgi:hypothetical protein